MTTLEKTVRTTVDKVKDELIEITLREILLKAIDEANRNIEPIPPKPRIHLAEDKDTITIYIGSFEYYVCNGGDNPNKVAMLRDVITMIVESKFNELRQYSSG